MSENILEIRNVGHSFGGFKAITNVSFDVPRGSVTGLIGPNGSGKTTLFNIVTGYLHRQQGQITYNQSELAGLSVADRADAGIIRTFQTPKIFDDMSVVENIMVGCAKFTRSSMIQDIVRTPWARDQVSKMRDRAMSACTQLGLERLVDVPGSKLTAGQRRMLELARAVVSEPALLLLDEPSSGLSSEETDRLKETIASLNGKGMSILLVSHDMGLMHAAQQVSVLHFGEIIASGSMREISADKRVRQVYLGG